MVAPYHYNVLRQASDQVIYKTESKNIDVIS